MLVWQFLLRMPWRRAGNSSGSTASWHRVSACILTGSMLQGLSVHRAKCNEKGVIRAIMICIRLRAFVILRLQFHCTEKVVQLRSSTASPYRAYLVNSMRFSI